MKRSAMLATALVTALTIVALGRFAGDHRNSEYRRTHQAGKAGGPSAPTDPSKPGASTGSDAPGSINPSVTPDEFFTPTRLKPGERPPQFVIVSFDGAGSHEKWRFWSDVADSAGMRFTGFLSGVYLVDEAHAGAYQAPGHRAGASDVGFADDGAWITTLVNDLNAAWQRGDEIGTHYNGHFCSGSNYGVGSWSTADWNSELDQFFRFYTDYKKINAVPNAPDLQVPLDSIKGGRTPCLEGQQKALFPALRQHGMTYDSSGDSNGIAWPTQRDGIWQFPMAWVPMAGMNGSGVISMDYNFFYKQHQAKDADPATAKQDSQQVLQTYRQMFTAAYNGNRAPLVLGNHFNSWNHNAYSQALADFVRETCKKPEVKCVPYRDVIRWMDAQDPKVLAELQARDPVDTVG